MQALFYILVAVAIAVGIWQFTKVLNLNRTVANTKDNNIQGKLMLGFLVVFYLWMFFTVLKWKHVFLPDAATEEGYPRSIGQLPWRLLYLFDCNAIFVVLLLLQIS